MKSYEEILGCYKAIKAIEDEEGVDPKDVSFEETIGLSETFEEALLAARAVNELWGVEIEVVKTEDGEISPEEEAKFEKSGKRYTAWPL